MGEQNLYNLTLTFVPEKGSAQQAAKSFGIRTIEMMPFPNGPKEDNYN